MQRFITASLCKAERFSKARENTEKTFFTKKMAEQMLCLLLTRPRKIKQRRAPCGARRRFFGFQKTQSLI